MLGTNLVLLVKPSATIVTEVVSALLPFGIKLKRYFTEDVTQGKRLTLILSESEGSADGVIEHLLEINGVLTVLETPWHAAGVQSAPATDAASGEVRFDSRLVDRIVGEFPVILPLLVAFEETVPAEARAQQLRLLGARVGAAMAGDCPALAGTRDLGAVLKRCVVPMLTDVADAEARNGVLRMRKSIFTRNDLNAAATGGATGLCAFCEGLVEGLVHGAPALAHVRVTETRCRDKGADACEFEIG